MIPLLLILAAAQAAPVPQAAPAPQAAPGPRAVPAPIPQAAPAADTSAQCLAVVKANPSHAVQVASDWRLKGGGVPAQQCLGLAYAALERWPAAATAFEQAAAEAESRQDPRRGDLWVQAGNSWLAAGDGAKARKAFDAALVTTLLTQEMRGEVHLDRGRAGVALGDLAGARADIDKGLQLVPADPFGWYLSSALALKERRLARAQDDIAEAVRLAPDDANLLLHAGNVAGISGEVEAARGLYAQAIKAAPNSPAAKAARTALAANAEPAQSR
ncbi:MAG TPA: hypothetical protein VF589_04665 [Allosphingosinicella sp.]